jgi:hypothetical protein
MKNNDSSSCSTCILFIFLFGCLILFAKTFIQSFADVLNFFTEPGLPERLANFAQGVGLCCVAGIVVTILGSIYIKYFPPDYFGDE